MASATSELWVAASPAIIGVISPTRADTGHAVFWDGEKLIDPEAGPDNAGPVDRAYVDRFGLEFTQRAGDLIALMACDTAPALAGFRSAPALSLGESF